MKAIKALLFVALIACASMASAQNSGKILFASGARTATSINSIDQINTAARGAVIVVDITTATAGNYTFTVQGKDPASLKYYTILATTALATTGTTILRVYPGLTAAANATASDVLPAVWRVNIVGASSPNMVFSVGAISLQ